MRHKIKITLLSLLTVAFFLNAQITNCFAENPVKDSTEMKASPWFVERFRVTGGIFVPVSTTSLQVGVQGGAPGSQIDFQKDLGLNSTQFTFLSNLQWRISRRSRLSLSYYNISRNSTHTLDKDITFKGQDYYVDATVKSFFNTAIYQVSYGYAILAKPDYEVGVLIGTHLVGGKAGLSVVGTGGEASASTDYGFTAPLPDLGIWGGYAFSKRFAVNLNANYLSLTVGDVSGSIFAYDLLLIYRLIDKLDLSLGYSGLNFDVKVSKPDVRSSFKWGFNGPSLGATYSFGRKSWR
jgi:hypothetical protein